MINVEINSKYYREQFDDWLAGGMIEYQGKIYYWSARNSYYGWEIEPIREKDWYKFSYEEFNEIIAATEECLYKYKTEYFAQ